MIFPYIWYVYLRENRLKFLNHDVFLSLKVVLILSNSADPDKMQHNAVFHLGRYCLPKYMFRNFGLTLKHYIIRIHAKFMCLLSTCAMS